MIFNEGAYLTYQSICHETLGQLFLLDCEKNPLESVPLTIQYLKQ